jgi:1-aminocyclopropane-1-carboxylate deaminase/D-cysteine desulfhydrase-like pyridoxal-dependent ACC family enzyme
MTTISLSHLPSPVVELHGNVSVVREDLLPGGTKLRYIGPLALEGHTELVYATSAQGGAQLALAYAARAAGIKATLFVARRGELHPRTREAIAVGAKVIQVEPGYLAVVQKRAKDYATSRASKGTHYVEFGGASPRTIEILAAAAAHVAELYGRFDEVWCSAGSGVLSLGLQRGIPDAQHVVVCCGHHHEQLGDATLRYSGVRYGVDEKQRAPFPACPTYERKTWRALMSTFPFAGRRVLFWNVMGESPTGHAHTTITR